MTERHVDGGNEATGLGSDGGPLVERWIRDSTVRCDRRLNTVLGGSPLTLLRLSDKGMDLVDLVLSGDALSGDALSEDALSEDALSEDAPTEELRPAEVALVEKLVAAGMIHPVPVPGSSGLTRADVTVLIPVKDDAAKLHRLLRSLGETCPGVRRVIVVDDGSIRPLTGLNDGSDLQVELIRRDASGGPGVARNDGAALVDTQLIAFLDVDCTPTVGWLDRLIEHFGNPNVSAVAPRVVAGIPNPCDAGTTRDGYLAAMADKVSRHLIRYDRSHSPLDLGTEPARVLPCSRVSYVPTAALLVQKRSFVDVGGFDIRLRVGEDVDLIWRLVAAGDGVRYEPNSVVEHEVRRDLASWIRQRFDYGTSAAPLAARHGSAVAPVAMSRWSVAVWALALGDRRRTALALAAATTVTMHRKLGQCSTSDVVRIVIGGHLGAARQLAHASVRAWWPLTLGAALVSRRTRRVLAAGLLWSIIDDRPTGPTDVVLGLVDDAAYGSGVWVGCLRDRSVRALLPKIT